MCIRYRNTIWQNSTVVSFTQQDISAPHFLIYSQGTVAPNKQMKIGIKPNDVVCPAGMVLSKRPHSNSIACLKPQNALKLFQRGWEAALKKNNINSVRSSLLQTGAQSESILIQGVKLWVNATDSKGTSWGAAALRNTGDKLESLDTISVRGFSVPYTSWYYTYTTNSSTNIQEQFVYGTNDNVGLLKDYSKNNQYDTCNDNTASPVFKIDVDGGAIGKPTMCFIAASGPILLKPGDSAVVYFHLPEGVLSTIDVGASMNVSIYADKDGLTTAVSIENP